MSLGCHNLLCFSTFSNHKDNKTCKQTVDVSILTKPSECTSDPVRASQHVIDRVSCQEDSAMLRPSILYSTSSKHQRFVFSYSSKHQRFVFVFSSKHQNITVFSQTYPSAVTFSYFSLPTIQNLQPTTGQLQMIVGYDKTSIRCLGKKTK